MVVDDCADNREAVAELLRLEGYEVAEASAGAEALAMAAAFEPHVYLLDVVMPDFSGLELLEELKTSGPAFAAIMMTGYENVEDARRAMELGACSYIGKPVTHDDLIQQMRSALAAVAGKEHENEHRAFLERENEARTRELREALRMAEFHSNHLDMVLNGMREGLVAIDDEGVITQINEAAGRLLGISMRGAPGTALFSALSEEAAQRLTALLEKADASDSGVHARGHLFCKQRILSVSVSNLRTDNRAIMGRILIFSDETDKTNNERMRAGFLNIVAHEFRTPLQIVLTNMALLQDPAVRRGDIDEIVRDTTCASKRLASLVDKIMRVASVSLSGAAAQRKIVALGPLLKEQIRKAQNGYPEKRVTIQYDNQETPPRISTDPGLLADAVCAIIDNAIKFSPDGGEVRVAAHERPHEGIDIVVTDQAGGIPADKRDSIFRWFEQEQHYLTRRHEGIGLGLAMARQAVELIGGSIVLENEEGGGSRFIVRLPGRAS
jgi:PAS domain S-box-containing protein